MGRVNGCIRELVEAPCRADNRLLSNKPSKRLRTNAFGDEILEAKHTLGLQEVERTKPLGASGRHGE
jgi:hypothetical protein